MFSLSILNSIHEGSRIDMEKESIFDKLILSVLIFCFWWEFRSRRQDIVCRTRKLQQRKVGFNTGIALTRYDWTYSWMLCSWHVYADCRFCSHDITCLNTLPSDFVCIFFSVLWFFSPFLYFRFLFMWWVWNFHPSTRGWKKILFFWIVGSSYYCWLIFSALPG